MKIIMNREMGTDMNMDMNMYSVMDMNVDSPIVLLYSLT